MKDKAEDLNPQLIEAPPVHTKREEVFGKNHYPCKFLVFTIV